MTNATEVKKELTVSRYEFYKSGGMTDAKIMKIHGLDHNQLYKWKKENDLVGKDYGLRGGPSVKIYKASEEVKPLKENDIPKERLAQSAAETEKAIQEYSANKKVQEKLKEKQVENITPATFLQQAKEAGHTIKEIGHAVSKALDEKKTSSIEETQETIDLSWEEEFKKLQKEKAWLEERHVKDTAEMDVLRLQLEKAKQASHYQEFIEKVNRDVKAERHRQNGKWGHQRHAYGDWLMILTEEVGEVAQAMQKSKGWGKESDADDLYKELIHVSAVSSAIAEQVLEELQNGEANPNG